jgi:hypothetical protein
MEVKVGGGDRILVLLGSLVSGWVVRVGVRAGWIEVPVGERRSDMFPESSRRSLGGVGSALREARRPDMAGKR